MGDISHINLHIHSPGGDVFDGIAILDKANNKEWYVNAAQGTDTIEVAYLDGMDVPYLEQQEGFIVDGIAWKVRIDAGVAALNYRGMVKSSGAA
ncbi:TPA: ATP-dependent Clp protease proteolytic subunit [Enterobacter roggenkampii]